MRDIVATIQRHQDEAIRAPSRGVTEITGGPGTGKTVVALHRAAYLLYSERRRFENGGILVVGPSTAYTAYIERVLPSLGEESVSLRALGDLVEGMTAQRVDAPEVAAIKGSLRIRRLLSRLTSRPPAGAPNVFRSFVAGIAVRLDDQALRRVRSEVLRTHQHNLATDAARTALAEAAWRSVRQGERDVFLDAFDASRDVDEFMATWWRQLDPRELLLSLADTDHVYAVSRGVLDHEEGAAVAYSYRQALETGSWSVSDAALVDDLVARLGAVQVAAREDVGFYDIEELDELSQWGVLDVRAGVDRRVPDEQSQSEITPTDARERLMMGRIDRPSGYAHVLVDEAQDLSPMQWRALARRGRAASWTVVGDAAQASWSDLAEAGRAREEAFSGQERRAFHMDTNYRNAREIFDYARDFILPLVPDADIPDAVRETGIDPVDRVVEGSVASAAADAVDQLLGEVEGSIAVIAARRWAERLAGLDGAGDGRVQVDRPALDQGPGVGRDGRRRPAGDRRGVARRGAGALRRAHPRGAPDARAAPLLTAGPRTQESQVLPRTGKRLHRGTSLSTRQRWCGAFAGPWAHSSRRSRRRPQSRSGKRWMISCRPGPTPIAETRAPTSSSTRST